MYVHAKARKKELLVEKDWERAGFLPALVVYVQLKRPKIIWLAWSYSAQWAGYFDEAT